MKKFSLIICGYNEEENLDLCITSCLEQNYPKQKYEIIYVDNNSKDNSLKIAKKYPIRALTEKKQGVSEARNKGIKNSKGDIYVFIDSDTKISKDFLKNLEIGYKKYPHIGASGGKVLPLIDTWISNYLGVSLFERYPKYNDYRYVRTQPSCNLSVKREVLNKIGLFSKRLETAKGINRPSEDKELCERIRKAGYKILYNPEIILYHKNTYNFKNLLRTWVKGSKGRLNIIKIGKTDPFTILFKYNLPVLGILIGLFSLFYSLNLFYLLFSLYLFFSISLSIKAYYDTNLFFQSFLIKPWMDFISIIIINFSVLYYRLQ